MVNHDYVADIIDARMEAFWDAYRRIRKQCDMLVLLAFAHRILDSQPNATFIRLEESDQDAECMHFVSIRVGEGEYDAERAGLNEDQIWSYAASISPRDIVHWPFWIDNGNRNETSGSLDIAALIEHLTPLVAQIVDPPPDLTDPAALETWLKKEIA